VSGSRNMIYGFTDPRTRELRYVGRSSTGMLEPRAHIYNARRGRRGCPYCYNMLRAIFARGLEPVIEVIETLLDDATDDLLNEREEWWIALGRAWGCRLTNLTDGGGGISGYVFTAEQRAKLSASQQKRLAEPEAREKNRAVQRVAQARPDVRSKKSAALRETWSSMERRAKQSAEQCAAWSSHELRARHSVLLREKWASPELRAKQSATAHKVKSTAEARAKNRAVQRKTWASQEIRAKQRATMREVMSTPAMRAKLRAAWARPEMHAKMSAAAYASWTRRRAKEVLATQQGPM